MLVYDNAIPESYADDIEKILGDNIIQWYFNDATVDVNEGYHLKIDENTTESPFMTHGFYREGVVNSPWYMYFKQLVDMVIHNHPEFELYRCKANLYLRDSGYPENHHHTAHTDDDKGIGSMTALYFANDSDGDTLFFDQDMNVVNRVSPKKNRIVIFNSDQLHAGTPPKINNYRTNINIVLRQVPYKGENNGNNG
jgi:hypothetical protein